MDASPPQYVPAKIVCRELSVSYSTLTALVEKHGLPFRRLPTGTRRYVLAEVAAWMEKRKRRVVKRPSEKLNFVSC